jgi:uncharacterized protein (TIGR02466 family)
MIRHEIFPVPVWQFEFDKANEFKEKIVPMFKEIEKNNPNDNIKYTKEGYTSYGPINNILDYDECIELKNFVMESVVEAIKDMGMEGYANMTGSWFNINRKYSSHGNHNHIPDVISGIYYVKANKDDARITFHDQNKVSNWPWRVSINPTFTSRTKSFVPKMGTLYLFPSFVEHSVEQQLKDQERISISFNTFIS